MEQTRNWAAVVCFAAFAFTIPLANWTLERYGLVVVPGLGPVASGVVWVGLAFVLRDLGQVFSNRWATVPAIALGVVLSIWLASPGLALASAVSFGVAETLDWLVYSPLAERRFVLAVLLSSFAGALLDSALFLRLAFDSFDGWWQLAVAKMVVVALVAPVAWWAKRDLPQRLRLT